MPLRRGRLGWGAVLVFMAGILFVQYAGLTPWALHIGGRTTPGEQQPGQVVHGGHHAARGEIRRVTSTAAAGTARVTLEYGSHDAFSAACRGLRGGYMRSSRLACPARMPPSRR